MVKAVGQMTRSQATNSALKTVCERQASYSQALLLLAKST